VSVPDWALPALSVKWFPDGPLSMAVAYGAITDFAFGTDSDWDCQPPLSDLYTPFSRSAATQGPLPSPLPPHVMSLPQYTASIVPLPSSLPEVSAFP